MKDFKKCTAWLLALALVAGLFAGCAGDEQNAAESTTQAVGTTQAAGSAPADAGTPKALKLFLPLNGVSNLDPALWSWGTHHARMGIFEGLTVLDNNFKPVPANAEALKPNADYTVWTITLRKDLKWSDGTPLTAKDYEYSFKRVMDPKTSVGASGSFITGVPIKGYEDLKYGRAGVDQLGVKAIDDTTLEITLSRAWPNLPVSLAESWALPVPQKVIEAKGAKEWATTAENIVSNGPFKVKTFTVNTTLLLEKNPNYYGTVNVDEVHILNSTASTVPNEFLAYQNGDVNVASLKQSDIEAVEKDAALSEQKAIFKSSIVYFMDLLFSENDILQKNYKVRQAIAMSLNKDMIAKDIMKDTVRAGNSLIPEIWATWGNDIGLKYDPAKAKQLMVEAGFPEGRGFPELTILISGTPTARELAIGQQITEGTGIKTKIVNEEWAAFSKDLQKIWPKDTIGYYISGSGTAVASYQGYFLNNQWDLGKNELPAASMAKYVKIRDDNTIDAAEKNQMIKDILDNETSAEGKKYRQLVAQAEASVDPAQQEALYKEAARLRDERAGTIAIDWENGVKLVKPEVKNFIGNPLLLGTPPLYFNSVTIESK